MAQRAQSFSKELGSWVTKQKSKNSHQDKHLVAFLAVKENVKEALDAGFSRKTIWKFFQENKQLECRYETFTRYVKRHLTEKLEEDAKGKARDKLVKNPTEISSFKFSATPKPSEELF